jgi:hypothetical protein
MPPCGYGRTSVRHYRNAVAVGFPTAKPPKALATGAFTQHATTMFFSHFVGEACSRQADKFSERCIRPVSGIIRSCRYFAAMTEI